MVAADVFRVLVLQSRFFGGFLQGQLKISAASQFWVEFVLHDDGGRFS